MPAISPTNAPIRPEVLHQAAEWLIRLQDEPVNEADRNAWRRWLSTSDEHGRAWQRAEQLTRLLDEVPEAVGATPLRRSHRRDRRAALGAIMGLLVGTPTAWLALQRQPWQYAVADHTTGIGQQRQVWLDDGSTLFLNTDTRVDMRYTAQERLLVLMRGEVLVQTAADLSATPRPFRMQTPHGQLQAMGTRFAVRLLDATSRIAVEEGAVRVSPKALPQDSRVVAAGQQATYGPSKVVAAVPLRRDALDWAQGVLNVQAVPLGEVVAELARYRPGIMRCDPGVASIPVSGVFRLDDIDKALRLLQETFPVQIHSRSRYWTVVAPR